MISVLLVDDHQLVRDGLATLLNATDDITVIGMAEDGAVAVQRAAELQPDVILMDLSMPVMDGVESTRLVRQAVPGCAVVVLTSFGDKSKVHAAIDAGAAGYLLKDSEPRTLIDAVRAAASGGVPLDPRVAGALLTRADPNPASELSDRELEVLRAVAAGLLNKQIALRLGIAEKTVKAHLTNVFKRIGVTDRTQAALWAERNGLL